MPPYLAWNQNISLFLDFFPLLSFFFFFFLFFFFVIRTLLKCRLSQCPSSKCWGLELLLVLDIFNCKAFVQTSYVPHLKVWSVPNVTKFWTLKHLMFWILELRCSTLTTLLSTCSFLSLFNLKFWSGTWVLIQVRHIFYHWATLQPNVHFNVGFPQYAVSYNFKEAPFHGTIKYFITPTCDTHILWKHALIKDCSEQKLWSCLSAHHKQGSPCYTCCLQFMCILVIPL